MHVGPVGAGAAIALTGPSVPQPASPRSAIEAPPAATFRKSLRVRLTPTPPSSFRSPIETVRRPEAAILVRRSRQHTPVAPFVWKGRPRTTRPIAQAKDP